MNIFHAARFLLVVFGVLYLVVPQPAHAYLDPGTGSYLIQLIFGGGLAAFFAVPESWKKFTGFLTRSFSWARKS